jgi:hypothetical protein
MSDDFPTNNEMDAAVEAAEADTQAVLAANAQKRRSLPNRLRNLYQNLEANSSLGADWSLARALEDRIGAGQQLRDDYAKAEQLLARHGF